MCYSAQIEADYRKYVHMFGAQMSIREFARLYWERAEGSKANVPKAMDDAFSNPQTDKERKVKACIEKFNAAHDAILEEQALGRDPSGSLRRNELRWRLTLTFAQVIFQRDCLAHDGHRSSRSVFNYDSLRIARMTENGSSDVRERLTEEC
jgi:hypothetical protein